MVREVALVVAVSVLAAAVAAFTGGYAVLAGLAGRDPIAGF